MRFCTTRFMIMLKTDLLRGIVPATGRAYIGCSSIVMQQG